MGVGEVGGEDVVEDDAQAHELDDVGQDGEGGEVSANVERMAFMVQLFDPPSFARTSNGSCDVIMSKAPCEK